ncbi:MAG: IS1 family transposase [Solirubrobacteraceae bacterium]
MNRLSTERRAQVIGCLVEGNSIRATVRMTGAAKNTITKLVVELGEACSRYQDAALVDLPCTTIQCDEIWNFCYAKAKNVPVDRQGQFGYGDVWTWIAICADTKLVPSWFVGQRDADDGWLFMMDLKHRLRDTHVQMTTDGLRAYSAAIGFSFGADLDWAVLQKQYGKDPAGERRYSPAVCTGIDIDVRRGDPDPAKISTSYVERQNLTMRMGMRRFTRLTNAFSKKVENMTAAVSLHYMHYNFARVHQTLGTTPAIAAGVTSHRWTLHEIAELPDLLPN